MKKVLLSFAILAMIFLSSCTKPGPEGPTGSAGTNGKDGAAGIAGTNGTNGAAGTNGTNGADGTNGVNGKDGSANVLWYSITIKPSDWVYNSTYSEWYYDFLNSSNFKSAVLGYVMSGNGQQPLPYSSTIYNCLYTMASNLFQTTPYIQFQFKNYTTANVAPSSDLNFYLIIIPPTTKKGSIIVDWNNFEEVKKVFNLGEPIKVSSSNN